MGVYKRQMLRTMLSLKKEFRNGLIPEKKIFGDIEVAAYKGNARAAVSISADFELSWAWRGRFSPEQTEEMGKRERENVPIVLQILDAYRVPITWATVGHLFLDGCNQGKGGLAHAEMPRPLRNDFWDGDWYMHDPCTDYHRDPSWYCPDLIQQILESDVRHEIATHSFSHINCLPDYATESLVRTEIDKCRDAMHRFGIKPRSMVYPNNKLGHLKVLSEQDIIGVRKRDPNTMLSYPVRGDEGIYQVIETLSLGKPRLCRFIDKARILLDLAMKRNAVLSVWFHPSAPREILTEDFRQFVEETAHKMEKGLIWIATIEELAGYCEARREIGLEMRRKENELNVLVRSNLDAERYGRPSVTLIVKSPGRPRVALIEEEGDVREEKNIVFRKNNVEGEVIVDVPVSANSVRILL